MAADRRLADPEALLARVPLFSGLNPKEIRQLAELCLPKALRPRATASKYLASLVDSPDDDRP